MLEAYSTGITLASGSNIPFNNVSIVKGTNTELVGVSSVTLNKCGVYEVCLDVYGLPSAAGAFTVAMTKNGVVQNQVNVSIPTVATTAGVNASIRTLVQVSENNTSCCCKQPTVISFTNTGVALSSANTHLTVLKVC